jgi:hypothetical protein
MTLRPFFRKAARLEYDEAAGWYESQRSGLGLEFVSEIERSLLRSTHNGEAPLFAAQLNR